MSWHHLRDTTPRAAKPYQCYLCEETIAKGETHVCRTGIGEDGPLTSRMHVACEALTSDWDEDDWETIDCASIREQLLAKGGRP